MNIQHLGIGVDLGIIAFLLLQTFLGWRRGLLWQAAGIASMAFGVLLGLFLAPLLTDRLTEHITSDLFHAKLVAFLFVLGAVGLTFRLAAAWAEVRAEHGLPRQERERRRADDRLLGGIFGALKGSVLALVIIAACVSFFPNCQVWQYSRLSERMAVAGSRLLPQGAVEQMRRWSRKRSAEF